MSKNKKSDGQENTGAVSVAAEKPTPKKVTPAKKVVDEVPLAEVLKQTSESLKMGDKLADLKKEMQGFLGLDKGLLTSYLDDLKLNKLIKSYRLVPIGAAATMDFDSARVTVVVDNSGKVIDVEMS